MFSSILSLHVKQVEKCSSYRDKSLVYLTSCVSPTQFYTMVWQCTGIVKRKPSSGLKQRWVVGWAWANPTLTRSVGHIFVYIHIPVGLRYSLWPSSVTYLTTVSSMWRHMYVPLLVNINWWTHSPMSRPHPQGERVWLHKSLAETLKPCNCKCKNANCFSS